jgi:hypothetical protein
VCQPRESLSIGITTLTDLEWMKWQDSGAEVDWGRQSHVQLMFKQGYFKEYVLGEQEGKKSFGELFESK